VCDGAGCLVQLESHGEPDGPAGLVAAAEGPGVEGQGFDAPEGGLGVGDAVFVVGAHGDDGDVEVGDDVDDASEEFLLPEPGRGEAHLFVFGVVYDVEVGEEVASGVFLPEVFAEDGGFDAEGGAFVLFLSDFPVGFIWGVLVGVDFDMDDGVHLRGPAPLM